MRTRSIAATLTAGAIALGMVVNDASAQTRSAATARTPWGTPDLQGTWTGSTLTPLERPAEFAGKTVLTVEEAGRLEARARERARQEPQAGPGDPGTYNQIWFDPSSAVVPDRRTSLIVDPPDGRLPFTAEGRALATRHASHYGVGPRDNPEDLDTGERCLTDGVPIPYWTGYNNNYQIVQTPHYVMIRSEMYHNVRVIPLDNRARTNVPQWMGEPRGRWEGDTLVVETSSFVDRSGDWWATAWRASRPTLRLVERFTRTDAESIEYEFTMTDPSMFTRPWTARFPLTTNQAARGVTKGPLYEYACHEGNYSLANVLRGARAQEAVPAATVGTERRR